MTLFWAMFSRGYLNHFCNLTFQCLKIVAVLKGNIFVTKETEFVRGLSGLCPLIVYIKFQFSVTFKS